MKVRLLTDNRRALTCARVGSGVPVTAVIGMLVCRLFCAGVSVTEAVGVIPGSHAIIGPRLLGLVASTMPHPTPSRMILMLSVPATRSGNERGVRATTTGNASGLGSRGGDTGPGPMGSSG